MALTLSSVVTDVPRVGPAKAKLLARLGITHARDFLYTFPRRYEDFSRVTPIASLRVGEKAAVRGRVAAVDSQWGFQGRRRVLRIFVDIADDTGTLQVTWYNLKFLPPQLWQGRELYVAGLVEDGKDKNIPHPQPLSLERRGERILKMRSPALEFVRTDGEQTHTAAITPVYPETAGVTSRFLRYQVKNLLPLLQQLPEYLPAEIRERQQLVGIHDAIRAAHFPSTAEELARAQERLRFDEIFFLQLAALVRQQQRQQRNAVAVARDAAGEKKCISQLPFALTASQRTAVDEVLSDMGTAVPMNRLLQGDVGSGKSVVALIAAAAALRAQHSVLYLAPTEILARQQAEYFAAQLGTTAVQLLVGSQRAGEKQRVKEALASGQPVCVVGTHALLQEDVVAPSCALVIADEQHRFGVAQRSRLQRRTATDRVPHLLSMTATPIPRTLCLTVYGDLAVSVLTELPPGRKPIITKIIAPTARDAAMVHVLEELHRGRQAYVIAPLVADSPKLEVKSATTTAAEMHQLFPDVAIGLLHGQLPPAEKEQVLRHFAAGALQLLVATAIVEVGVNVPNATIMLIEGAERFGIAQLHQFRGRIGRGSEQSYCYLLPTSATSARSERLSTVAATTDGFVLAEKDLTLRGPGEVYGVAQSGFGNLQVASLLDYPLISRARAEAEQLLAKDPALKRYPVIARKVAQKNFTTHFE